MTLVTIAEKCKTECKSWVTTLLADIAGDFIVALALGTATLLETGNYELAAWAAVATSCARTSLKALVAGFAAILRRIVK